MDRPDPTHQLVTMPVEWGLAFPANAIYIFKRERATIQIDALRIRIDPQYGKIMCALLIKTNAYIDFAMLQFNSQVIHQWRAIPSSPEVFLYLPCRTVPFDHASDYVELELCGFVTQHVGAKVDVTVAGVLTDSSTYVTRF